MILGHRIIGKGKEPVLIMHDWFCDCTSYDNLLPYLDTGAFTFVFADLRGYGRSKEKEGVFTLDEAQHDLLALVDALHWKTFHVIGHSMTGLVAQQLLVSAQHRIKSLLCITPTPASGSPIPADIFSFLEDAAKANDESAKQIVNMMTGNRLAEPFIQYKVKKWRETSHSDARVGYLHMFVHSNISEKVKGIKTPTLVIVGEQDAEGHRKPAMEETFMKWYPNCQLEIIQNSGHYPMQEAPAYLASIMHQFLIQKRG